MIADAPRLAAVHEAAQSTYVDALPLLLDPAPAACTRRSSRPSRRPAGCRRPTRTSRTSPSARSSGRKIRHAFVAGDPDVVLLAADYSQIELRILAHVSRRRASREAFERRADIHRETAARVLKKDARRR